MSKKAIYAALGAFTAMAVVITLFLAIGAIRRDERADEGYFEYGPAPDGSSVNYSDYETGRPTPTTYADPEDDLEEQLEEGPATSFGDGTYEVGVDVAPGRYRNEGGSQGEDGGPCVAFTSRKPNDIGSYLRGSTTKGPSIIDVRKGEFLSVNYCLPWVRD